MSELLIYYLPADPGAPVQLGTDANVRNKLFNSNECDPKIKLFANRLLVVDATDTCFVVIVTIGSTPVRVGVVGVGAGRPTGVGLNADVHAAATTDKPNRRLNIAISMSADTQQTCGDGDERRW